MKKQIYEFFKDAVQSHLHDLMAGETQDILDIEEDEELFEDAFEEVMEQFLKDVNTLKFKK